jgi:predicted ferric reductase
LALLTVLWVVAEHQAFEPPTFFAFRAAIMQYSGILGTGAMSVAMILTLRQRWPEASLGGLDKMYRLHKWLGITSLVVGVLHWQWARGPRWAAGLGLLARPVRGARPAPESQIEQFFMGLRGRAEDLGEWTFYAAVLLIAVALIRRIPYRRFWSRLDGLVRLSTESGRGDEARLNEVDSQAWLADVLARHRPRHCIT